MSLSPLRTGATVFRPATRQPVLVAGGVAGAAALLALVLLLRGVTDGVTFAAFLCYVVAGALVAAAAVAGYWAWALSRLRYELGHGALTIVWGFTRQIVPLVNMERVIRGRATGAPHLDGPLIPGWPASVGRGRAPRIGRVLLYSTHTSPAGLLYLITPGVRYGISPIDQDGFIRALQQAMPAEEDAWAREIRQEVRRERIGTLPALADRAALAACAAGVLLGLLAIAVVFARYGGLPDRPVIPFPDGDHVARRREVLGIPLAAAALLLINAGGGVALHRGLRPAAYVLFLGGAFAQLLLLVAAISSF